MKHSHNNGLRKNKIHKELHKKKIDETDILSDIACRFNRCVATFIKVGEAKRPNDINIPHLKRLITLGKAVDESILIQKCHKNLWRYKEYIKNRDLSLFKSYDKILGDQDPDFSQRDHAELVHNLFSLVSEGLDSLNDEELTYLWDLSDQLIYLVAEYKALIEHGIDFYNQYKLQLYNFNL